ncbi:MAG: discoidin domain-containing protein [Streptosporangiales bacterium]|nr:discoidin domain-containing protein [Streptosporangiales bacterium]
MATWMLTAPACLTQQAIAHQPFTLGIFMPADQIQFQNDHHSGATDQPYGMSLGDDDGLVRPLAFVPQLGVRSRLAAGESHDVTFGLVAEHADLTTTYERLLRSEYDYRDYRENVYGKSMTDTMYNLIDLVMVDSGKDDSVDFQPSPSGWWNRAKGFVDIENPQTVRTTSAGVLLEAYLLTGDDDLYDKRAVPTIEFHVSRNGYGWTPKKGFPVYGDTTKYRLGSIPFDASTLSPLYNMTRGWNAGIKELAVQKAGVGDDYWLKRTPWSTSLALYRMTGDRAHLRDAETTAHAYIATEIDKTYTTNLRAADFQYFYSKAWTELLELYEVTSNQTYLEAAHKEARRYITQVFVRPVPDGSITVPRPPVVNHVADGWEPSAIFAYPRTSVTPETAPDWVVSTNGVTFEALTTYDNVGGGYTLNAAWAPFLLRLADHTRDELMADVATNAIVGRYTNYPGYYNRQFMVAHIKPDFPLQGPSGASAIYYSHIPVQLGMTIDWLITEQMIRSRDAINFPSEFEATYVWFKYHTYGHEPGRFYGDDNVWLWMPRGIANLDNPQVNWVSAEGNGRLYLSLTNASRTQQSVSVTLDGTLAGFDPGREYRAWIIQDNGARRQTVLRNGRVQTSVSPKGITAVIVDGVNLNVPLHEPRPASSGDKSFHFDDSSPVGIVRGMLLVKPDLSRYDAYIQADTESTATLHYSIDGGATYITVPDDVYPNEWTIPVPDLATPFRYFVEAEIADNIDIASAEASSERAANPASNAIDGTISDTSRWLSVGSDTQPTLTLTFSAPTQVGRLVIVSGNFLSGSGAYQSGSSLNSFRVEAELNGAWTQVADISGNDKLEVQVPFDVVTTLRLRLVITKGSSVDTTARVYEVYAYASEGPATKRTDETVLSLDGD